MKFVVFFFFALGAAVATGLSHSAADVGFYLYSDPNNPTASQTLTFDKASIKASNYDGNKRLLMYIGGLTSTRTTEAAVVNAYLSENYQRDYNVIVVDWGALNGNQDDPSEFFRLHLPTPMTPAGWEMVANVTLYKNVTTNVPIVGERVQQFITFLSRKFNKRFLGTEASAHLIGNGLGAHIAGVAGGLLQSKTKRTLLRITGLDPTGPPFQDAPIWQRLDYTDAYFVDVLYTNAGGAGYWGNTGHSNAYINGDALLNMQPECDFVGNPNVFCSHNFVTAFFAKSILYDNLTMTPCNINQHDVTFCSDLQFYDEISFGEGTPLWARGMYYINGLSSAY